MPFAWLPPPLVVGHRGAPHEATENTLAAFRAAAAQGARAVELDARLSRDGVVVVHHDPALGRAIPGRGLVEETDAADLQGLGMPTLADVLDALPAMLVDVELKADAPDAGGLPERVARVVREKDALDRVLVSSFDPDLAEAYGALVDRPVGWIVPFPVQPEDVPPRARFVMMADDAAVEDAIGPLRAAGLHVLVWTVDDAARAAALLDEGAAGVITDRPGALLAALRPRGASGP